VQQKIYWCESDEVRGNWRRLYKKELHEVYFWSNILLIFSRRMRWAGHVVGMVERRVACRVLVERPEEMRPLGKRKNRLEVNNKMDLYEVGRDVDCTDLDQDRNRSRAFVNLVINLPVL